MSDETAAVRAIQDAISTMFREFVEHRPEGVEAALHADCTLWDVFLPQLIQGRAERLAFHAADQSQSQARGPLAMSIDWQAISVWGDTGVARYHVDFDYAPPNAHRGRIRITSVLRREAGRWLIVHHHEGAMPAGVPPITEARDGG